MLCLCAGVYNEEVFASLDWVLAEAANRNLRIILPIEVRSFICFTHPMLATRCILDCACTHINCHSNVGRALVVGAA